MGTASITPLCRAVYISGFVTVTGEAPRPLTRPS
jgi:hypothetical protein